MAHDPEYIRWVKRSLNRLFAGYADIRTTDGSPTPRYRELIKAFQRETRCPTQDGSGDSATQERIVAISNVDTNRWSRLYIKWFQEALQAAGFGNGFAADGYMNAKTKDAIRSFQTKQGHKKIDGLVGFFTERNLVSFVPEPTIPGYFPGGWKPKPVDPVPIWEDDLIGTNFSVREINEELRDFIDHYLLEIGENNAIIIEPEERKATVCMLKKLRRGVGFYKTREYEYLSANAAHKIAQGHWPSVWITTRASNNALADLKSTVRNYRVSIGWAARYKLFKGHVGDMYTAIDDGIKRIWYEIGNKSGTMTGPYAALNDWWEDRNNDPSTIISCFPGPKGGLF